MDDILKILNNTDRIHFKTEEKVNIRKISILNSDFIQQRKEELKKINSRSLHSVK